MSSKKLQQAVAARNVVVKNVQPGEVMLHIKGQPHCIQKGQMLDVTALLDNPKDAMRIGGLSDLLKRKHLVLV